jgi:hypothetical protein
MTINDLNAYIQETYGTNFFVLSGHGKYALMDDDFELRIPLIISEKESYIIAWVHEFYIEK